MARHRPKNFRLFQAAIILATFLESTEAFLGQSPPATSSIAHEANNLLGWKPRRYRQQRNENLEADTIAASKQQDGWSDAAIVSSRPACPSGKSTVIRVKLLQQDTKAYQQYTTPGQFVQFRYEDHDPIFLAIASPPDSNGDGFEFLIKMSPRLDWLPQALVVGNKVKLSDIMGKGFPLEKLDPSNDAKERAAAANQILLAAAGSGIAPLKACIESGRLQQHAQNNNNKIKLYYGEWTKDDLCYAELYESWKSKWGVEVVPALSREDDSSCYVQSLMKQEEQVQRSSDRIVGALLCGMDAMVEDCTSVLTRAGVPQEKILLNL